MLYILFLVDPPKVLDISSSVTEKETATATFHCYFEGKPWPDVDWFRNDTKLVIDNSRVTVSKTGDVTNGMSTLTIRKLNRTDEGMYKCVANNTIMSSVSSEEAKLTVNCKYNIQTGTVFFLSLYLHLYNRYFTRFITVN